MLEKTFSISDDSKIGTIVASKEFFEETAVLTTFGKYTSNYFISIQPIYEASVEITIKCKKSSPISQEFLQSLMNELIDQQIRLDLDKRFGELRKIIVKRAFEPIQL